ncbi:oxidoreductase HTATIP2-like [Xenia sp. Carnegie-2017]|uniref:oxidoreductase HTATIP2-like n=1 Tax=Xenia sp. Carnegie-2017 TaxID=2897299 RepID=UPI001F03B119|nr:oxidoreductase HTATIP2-like [Xenia sp. Carnegie-2017]
MAESEGAAEQSSPKVSEGMNLKALVIGGTGATGKSLIGELLSAKNFAKVIALGRRNATVPEQYNVDQAEAEKEGRLVQVTVDFETLTKESVAEHFQDGDVFFNTFGTQRNKAGSAEAFFKIDHDYPMKCIKIAKECGVKHVSVVTSNYAKADSRLLYLKTKGQIEEDCKKLEFERVSIIRPGLLGRGPDAKMSEKFFGFFFKAIQVTDIAKAMRIDAENVAKTLKSGETSGMEKCRIFFNADVWNMIKDVE